MENHYYSIFKDDKLTFNIEKCKKIFGLMKESICKIEVHQDNVVKYGSGFLCKILFGEIYIYCIITCNHVLDKDALFKIKKFRVSFLDEGHSYEININAFRIVYTNEKFDATIIEIKPKDGLDNHIFLEVDETKEIGSYENEFICLLHYPIQSYDCNLSIGKIIKIIGNNIIFSCFSKNGSSGGPILRLYNYKVLGIHRARNRNNDSKIGKSIKTIKEDMEYSYMRRITMINRAFAPLLLFWGPIKIYAGIKDKNGPCIQEGIWQIIASLHLIDYDFFGTF